MVDYQENKEEKERVRLTMGGGRTNYPNKVTTHTVDLPTIKLMLNIVISMLKARQMMVDIKHFYLNMPLKKIQILGAAIE